MKLKRIVSQLCLPEGVLATFEDGTVEMLAYEVDENGDEYIRLFPNDSLDAMLN